MAPQPDAHLVRTFVALKLSKLAGWLVGNRPVPESEQIARLRHALGEVIDLLPADHPACRVAARGLTGRAER